MEMSLAKGPGRPVPLARRAAPALAAATFMVVLYLFAAVHGNASDMATVQAQLTQTQADLASVEAQVAQFVAPARRVPAEWEPQRAVWLQWPRHWEYDGNTGIYTAFENIIAAMALITKILKQIKCFERRGDGCQQ